MPAFSFVTKPFSEFECSFLKFPVLGSFYELIYKEVFIFQCFELVRISLGLWDNYL